MQSKIKSVLLGEEVQPIEYNLELKPNLNSFTFEGNEEIKISVSKKIKKITLHSKEIKIQKAFLSDSSLGMIKIDKITYDKKSETVTFFLSQEINKGEKKLHIVFSGILNDKMRGFYRSKYLQGGKEKYLATTQFEATDARRAFPCFDEPALKAVFNISLIIEEGKTAISNTLPVLEKKIDGGFRLVKFATTPKMSTYLLAFIVGDFEMIQSKTDRGVLVRIFTTPNKKSQAHFALFCAKKMLSFYEKYFNIKYPLPILNMIAIPDFSAGAMENWGAITYRESALLIDEKNSSSENKQRVATVIAHEIAHQWFGNLVTMKWWTDLWLNEGFASYIEYLAVNEIFPKWEIWTQFTTDDLGRALVLDSLENTHPIEVKVNDPNEIGEIFDAISYSKGASIIKMLADYLGEDQFRDGLRHYLKKHSYKNTETNDLWKSFEFISKKPVAKIMRNWTDASGYPLLKTESKNGKILFTQKRFFTNRLSAIKHKNENTIWQIPFMFGDYYSNKKILLNKKNISLPVDQNVKKWQKVNLHESGFFRTHYSDDLLEKLEEPVSKKTLKEIDRLGIIRDLFALAESGELRTEKCLKFLKSYKNEKNYSVWAEISSGLSQIMQTFTDPEIGKKIDKLVIDLFQAPQKKLGFSKKKNELHTDSFLRSICLSRLGKAGDPNVIKWAKENFEKIKKERFVDPDLRSAIYGIIAKYGGKKEYEFFTKKYKNETLQAEKDRIAGALASFDNPKILEKTAKFALSKYVRSQDTLAILIMLGLNTKGRDVWLETIQKNWKMLVDRYGNGGHVFGRFVRSISGSAEEKHFQEFKKFFKTHQAPGGERGVKQALEKMENNILWKKSDEKNLEEYLINSVSGYK